MFFYVLLALLTLSVAQDARVEYVNKGALLLTSGEIKLNNPSPVTIVVEDFENCVGSVLLCLKSVGSAPYFKCGPGYCPMEIDFSSLNSPKAQVYTTGNTAEFVFKNPFCVPDFVDDHHSYKIAKLASNCRVIVKRVTDPSSTTTTPTTITKAEVTLAQTAEDVETALDAMIWGIVGGEVGFVVVSMVITVIVFIFVNKLCLARRVAYRRRNRANAITSASKTLPTAPKLPEVAPPPSTTRTKQVNLEPEVVVLSKPTPSEEPKPENAPSDPKRKKDALTPAEYEERIPIRVVSSGATTDPPDPRSGGFSHLRILRSGGSLRSMLRGSSESGS